MKTVALALGGFVFLLAGCAHQKESFSGSEFKALGVQEEMIWTKGSRISDPVIHNSGVIRAIRGRTLISENGKQLKKARVGMKFGSNAFVVTGENSIADIFLGENGPVIRLRQDTAIRFDRLDLKVTEVEKVIDTRIELHRGQILGSTRKRAATSHYLIRTPTSVLEVGGTQFSVNSEDGVAVISGAADLLRDGKRINIQAGFKYSPSTGVMAIPLLDLQSGIDFFSSLTAPIIYTPAGQIVTTVEGVPRWTKRGGTTCSPGPRDPCGPANRTEFTPPRRLDAY